MGCLDFDCEDGFLGWDCFEPPTTTGRATPTNLIHPMLAIVYATSTWCWSLLCISPTLRSGARGPLSDNSTVVYVEADIVHRVAFVLSQGGSSSAITGPSALGQGG